MYDPTYFEFLEFGDWEGEQERTDEDDDSAETPF